MLGIYNMTKSNIITKMPPYAVTALIKRLGRNIRTARLRRKLRLEEVAERIGISRFLLSDIEKGKQTASIAAYIGALWALGLDKSLSDVANPDNDKEGQILESQNSPQTAPKRHKSLDNDF